MFIREGTDNGDITKSIGVPSAKNGISASGKTFETTPLFPCLPTSLSPTFTFLVSATSTLILFTTPGSNLWPRSLENILTFTTLPFLPCSILKEESLTSFALSPKIALNNLSSGVNSASPFGEIFPTKMSLGPTSAPTLTIPSSSKSFNFSSPTLGISDVVTSGPSFVSRTSQVKSSICIEVNSSSFTSFSEIVSASSNPPPLKGKKQTKIFLPNASLPWLIAAPSASTSPFLIFSPFSTIGFWWKQEYWLVLTNVWSSYSSSTFFPLIS